jgi:activating signal cointegrator complex subunit 1
MAASGPVVEYVPSPSGHSILRPTLLQYDGMSFRKMTGRSDGFTKRSERNTIRPHYTEEDITIDEDYDESPDELKDIRELKSGDYELELDIPDVFFKYIIGRGGQTKQSIERDTKTFVFVPKQGQIGPLVVRGRDKRDISKAKQRIEIIVWSNRSKEDITHFLAIPINVPSIMEKFMEFKSQVNGVSNRCVDEDLFQIPVKLHATIQVFYLFDDKEENLAIKAIEECMELAKCKLSMLPLPLTVQGLDIMNDDQSAVRVLYGKIQPLDASSELQEFADCLYEELNRCLPSHLVKIIEGRTNVKLHVTLMNARFKEAQFSDGGRPGQGRRRNVKQSTFDARDIFKELSEFHFGELKLKELCLLRRGEYDKNGFYKCVKSFPI